MKLFQGPFHKPSLCLHNNLWKTVTDEEMTYMLMACVLVSTWYSLSGQIK
jgi:hypothetical protein